MHLETWLGKVKTCLWKCHLNCFTWECVPKTKTIFFIVVHIATFPNAFRKVAWKSQKNQRTHIHMCVCVYIYIHIYPIIRAVRQPKSFIKMIVLFCQRALQKRPVFVRSQPEELYISLYISHVFYIHMSHVSIQCNTRLISYKVKNWQIKKKNRLSGSPSVPFP